MMGFVERLLHLASINIEIIPDKYLVNSIQLQKKIKDIYL